MTTNCINTIKNEKVLEENSFFTISESKVIFKNYQAVIILNQISNVRLIKKRDFKANIIVLVFSVLFYVMVVSPLYLSTIFESIILALILICLMCWIENYSYRLLINKMDYDFNEIIVGKKNLHFARVFLSKFPASTLLKTDVKQECEFNYQDLKKEVA